MLLYAFWDVEATGLKVTEDAIISIGCILCRYEYDVAEKRAKFVPLAKYDTFISTSRYLDGKAEAVHGITRQMLQGKPGFPDAMLDFKSKLVPVIGDHQVLMVGFNSKGYDNIILFANFFRHQISFTAFLQEMHVVGFMDAFDLVKDLRASKAIPEARDEKGIVNMKLGSCHFTFCGRPIVGAHNALNDAEALVSIMNSPCMSKVINTSMMSKRMDTVKVEMARLQRRCTVMINQRQAAAKKTAVAVISDTAMTTVDEPNLSSRPFPYHTCLKCMHVIHLDDTSHVCILPPMFDSSSSTLSMVA